MGRRRLHDDPLRPLPKGLYRARRQFRTRHRDGHWIYFAGPYEDACRAYRQWRGEGPAEYEGSVAWLLDWYLTDIAPGRLRARTLRDYRRDAETIKAGLGKCHKDELAPPHIATYRDARVADGARVHVNRELAVLRGCYTAASERGLVTSNPCAVVRRMSEAKRDRLISDGEYLAVYARAVRSVQIAMTLCLRTLQRVNDVLHLSLRDVHRLDDGRRVLRLRQFKTQQMVEILVEGELERIVDEHQSLRPFVHTADGTVYTVDGIGAMFRRYCIGTKEKPRADAIRDFGLRDLRAKGATDLYRAGVDIRQIQALLGHRSVRTTEIYLKRLVPTLARPNNRPVIAEVK
jgi:integrase